MKKIIVPAIICIAAFWATSCKKSTPATPASTAPTYKVYLVEFDVTFTGGSGSNKIEYTNNNWFKDAVFNQPNSWSYELARKTGDTVSVKATSYDGTSAYVRISLNGQPWLYNYINTGPLPYVAAAQGVLP